MSEVSLRPDFLLSDSHFGHKNIVHYQNRPYDHEAMMVKRWRTIVEPSHTILHLGDLFFSRKGGLKHFAQDIAPQLTGHKFLILGNHDRRDLDYEALGFTVIEPYTIECQGYKVSFDHYPKIIHPGAHHLHLHGHIHANEYAPGEPTRANNINMSVEVIDYRPQRFTSVVSTAIAGRKSGGRFYNSKSYRQSRTTGQRRAAA